MASKPIKYKLGFTELKIQKTVRVLLETLTCSDLTKLSNKHILNGEKDWLLDSLGLLNLIEDIESNLNINIPHSVNIKEFYDNTDLTIENISSFIFENMTQPE